MTNPQQGPDLPMERLTGVLEVVAHFHGAMPTGVTVSREGRIFVNFPKWGDDVLFTVAEVRGGEAVPYPDLTTNTTDPDDPAAALVSVQSVVVDPRDRLWILDTGSPLFQSTVYGGPKLLCVDLTTNRVVRKILLPQDVALPTTYLNDIRFDLRRGVHHRLVAKRAERPDRGGPRERRQLAAPARPPLHQGPGPRGLRADGGGPTVPRGQRGPPTEVRGGHGRRRHRHGRGRTRLYYCPLGSRRLYSVSVEALANRDMSDAQVAAAVDDEGDKGGGADGLESDADGYVYATNYEAGAITRRRGGGVWETVVRDPRLLWPDTLSLAHDGYLYVTANQPHRQARYAGGQDARRKPYTLFRVRVDARPVILRPD